MVVMMMMMVLMMAFADGHNDAGAHQNDGQSDVQHDDDDHTAGNDDYHNDGRNGEA